VPAVFGSSSKRILALEHVGKESIRVFGRSPTAIPTTPKRIQQGKCH
jgi:hypothetical protein